MSYFGYSEKPPWNSNYSYVSNKQVRVNPFIAFKKNPFPNHYFSMYVSDTLYLFVSVCLYPTCLLETYIFLKSTNRCQQDFLMHISSPVNLFWKGIPHTPCTIRKLREVDYMVMVNQVSVEDASWNLFSCKSIRFLVFLFDQVSFDGHSGAGVKCGHAVDWCLGLRKRV